MERPNPCIVCGSTQTSIAYSQDPWCGVDCRKRLSRHMGLLEFEFTAEEVEAACRRLAAQHVKSKSKKTQLHISVLGEEIKRGRNGVEVYGSEDLLRKAERPGNWRDVALYFFAEGGPVS